MSDSIKVHDDASLAKIIMHTKFTDCEASKQYIQGTNIENSTLKTRRENPGASRHDLDITS